MRIAMRVRTHILYHPVGAYYAALVIAPVMFVCGMLLFYTDPMLGAPIKVEKDGVIGVAANISVTGLGAVMRFLVIVGPYVLVLLGMGLPIVAAIFVADLFDTKRFARKRFKSIMIWCGACGETFLLLALFIAAMEQWPV